MSGTTVRLTEREREVLRIMAGGATDAEIAHSCGIAVATVHTHVNALRRKLRAPNRTSAVVHGLVLGLIALDQLPLTCPFTQPAVAARWHSRLSQVTG